MFNFTKDCFVGIVNVDKKRLEYFETLNYALKDDDTESHVSKINNILDKLDSYAKEGFTEEEEYMTEVADSELELQIKEHSWFLERINEFKNSLENISDEVAKDELNKITRFMIKWMYSHIVSKDTLISKPLAVSQSENNCTDSEEDEDNPFVFTSKYLVGVASIDEEHKRLFEIIAEANEILHNDFLYDKYDQIAGVLENLLEYTKVHFADEEEYMESINYEGLEAQKKAHSKFIEKIENINLEDVDDNQDEYLNGILNFLLDWLANHILKVDKLIPCK